MHRTTLHIRSKSDPSVYWYDKDGFIVVSQTECTNFYVTGNTRPEKDNAIIPSDNISVSVVGKDNMVVT